jgi:hypothetical protein
VQELLGHKDVATTMIYAHVMEKGVSSVRSPLDVLADLQPQDVDEAVAASRRLHGGPPASPATGPVPVREVFVY